jgi:hypothetical protein
MQEVLGPHNDDASFDRYLANWREIHAQRTQRAIEAIVAIPGVRGLILAGSTGIGQQWPLSDIDLIPIYDDDLMATASDTMEQTRDALLEEWSTQDWRTGVDIGRLRFSVHELEAAFSTADPDPLPLLADDRWYYSLDKAWGGKAVHDCTGLGADLAAWFTRHRFRPAVVRFRLERTAASTLDALDAVQFHLNHDASVDA